MPPQTPGPTETPEPTQTICYNDMPPPMNVRLYWGAGANFQERRQYTCGPRQNAYFGAGVNYWDCMAPDGLDSVHLSQPKNQEKWRVLDNDFYIPARALWHHVPANAPVGVEFDLLGARFVGVGATCDGGPGENCVRPYDYTNYNSSNRGLLLFVQDLGDDAYPGGSGANEDRLIFLMTFAEGPGMGAYGYGDPPPAGHGPISVAGNMDAAWGMYTDDGVLRSTYYIPGRPTGLQAYRAPDVTILNRPIFERGGGGMGKYPYTPDVRNDPTTPRENPPGEWYHWPLMNPSVWPERFPNPYYTEETIWKTTLLEGDYEYGPDQWSKDNLRFSFPTRPNRAYRIIAIKQGTVCAGAAPLSTLTTMYFDTLGDGNVAIAKSAPEQEVRDRMMTYDIQVRNTSQTVTATNVVVRDELPDGVLTGQTFVTPPGATDPITVELPISPAPSEVNGRTIAWRIGNLAPGETRTFQVSVWIAADAPDRLTNVATVTAENDGNPTDNRAEATTLLVNNPTNVRVRVQAPRMVRPGDTFETTIRYSNTTTTTAENVRLAFSVPMSITLVSTSRDTSERRRDGSLLIWNIGTLPANADETITLRIRVPREDEAAAIPAMLEQTATIDAKNDADRYDNASTARTAVLITPRPQTTARLWIHSTLDPQRSAYRTSGASFTWPAGEALDFTPEVTIDDRQTGLPYYRLERRVVAWSFLGSGGLNANVAGCKPREEPRASETEHADLSRLRGCVYRYLDGVTPETLQGQGHLYWAQYPPERMRNDVYVITPLPTGGTDLRIQYAVLTEVVETGYFDVDEDGRADSVLERRTDVVETTYRVEFVVPRDAR